MNGNKAYLAEYQDYNGGPVAFGGSKGYITGKDTECLVLSSDFKLPDENQVLPLESLDKQYVQFSTKGTLFLLEVLACFDCKASMMNLTNGTGGWVMSGEGEGGYGIKFKNSGAVIDLWWFKSYVNQRGVDEIVMPERTSAATNRSCERREYEPLDVWAGEGGGRASIKQFRILESECTIFVMKKQLEDNSAMEGSRADDIFARLGARLAMECFCLLLYLYMSERMTGAMNLKALLGISIKSILIGMVFADKSWLEKPHGSREFYDGVQKFVAHCTPLVNSAGKIRCPCKRCRNILFKPIEWIGDHITDNGWDPLYTVWDKHGEPAPPTPPLLMSDMTALLDNLSYIPPNNEHNEPTQGDIGVCD
ncbi:hypothetical protein Tco_0770592 [Tanacetum coccineum]|uniref:Transposase-associated domain-containing protein n=1 Tax=Tanacetum coccineum TaxID=301880 RepID=A0ABQ4ZEL4_9ASTR